jgi:hypothetical protein
MYFFLAPPFLVPLEKSERAACAEIVVPFLLGQVAAVYRYFADPSPGARKVKLPSYVVKTPPILVTIIVIYLIGMMSYAGVRQDKDLIPDPEAVRATLTFVVALLNASTVFVISKYFESSTPPKESPTAQAATGS